VIILSATHKFTMNQHPRKIFFLQVGVSLIELSIWLIFVGVVFLATLLAYQAACRRSEVARDANIITNLVKDARFMYGRVNRFDQLTTEEAIDSGLIPSYLVNPTLGQEPLALNLYGGEIVIEQYPGVSETGVFEYALIRYGSVPSGHCAGLVTAVESLMEAVAVTRFSGRPNSGADFSVKFKPTHSELDISELNRLCQLEPTMYLQFKFKKE